MSDRHSPPRSARIDPAVAVYGLFVVFGLVIAAFFPFLAIYFEDKGLTPDRIGLVLAAMAVVRVFLLPVWGHVADTWTGRRTALQVAAAGAAVTACLLFVAQGFLPVAGAAVAVSVFVAGTGPNIDAIALAYLGDERMSDYGRIRGWESLSYAVGCFVFGAILQAAGIRWAMPIYGAMSLLVLGWSGNLPRDRPERVRHPGRLGTVGAVFREAPRFWGYLAAVFLLWTGFNAAWNFLSLRIADAGGGPMLIGIGTALGGLVEVPTMRLSSRLQRRWGLRTVYVLAAAIYAFGFLLWSAVSSPTVLALLTVFEGLAFGLMFTTGVVIVGRMLPASLYSTGNSVSAMVGFGIAPIVGNGVGGLVYEFAGPVALYAGASVLAVAAGVVAWFALSTPTLSEPERAAEPVA